MPDGDGGPDGPVASLFDLERIGPRSSPKVIDVMESSLTPRIGELGLSDEAAADSVLSAVAVGELWIVVSLAERLDLAKPCTS